MDFVSEQRMTLTKEKGQRCCPEVWPVEVVQGRVFLFSKSQYKF